MSSQLTKEEARRIARPMREGQQRIWGAGMEVSSILKANPDAKIDMDAVAKKWHLTPDEKQHFIRSSAEYAEHLKRYQLPNGSELKKLVKRTVPAGKLTAAERNGLARSDFAIPGKRKYPIHNIEHARNALARVVQNGTPGEQAQVIQAVYTRYPELNKTLLDKHFAALVTDQRGKEGLSIVDAPTATIATAKMDKMGLRPFHTPVAEKLAFGEVKITEVRDDGNITAKWGGKNILVTRTGQIHGPIKPGQDTYIKQSLGNSLNTLKLKMVRNYEKGKMPGAPLGKNGVPQRLAPARLVRPHRTRHGAGITRRSDR